MKRLNNLIRYSLIVLLLSTFQQKGFSQCLVDYTTYSYFCDLDTLILEAVPVSGVGPFSFIWETGQTTQTIHIPLALGDYMLTMTDANGCVSIINCHIKPFPEVLFYPYSQSGCEGDTVTLWLDWFRDSLPGATYLWSTGETTWSIVITEDITWSVTVTDPATGCSFVVVPNFFDFHPTPYPTIVGPTMLCPGQTATLSVTGGPFGNIYWLPDEIYAPTLDINAPGTYTVYAWSPEVGYCFHTDTITILPGDINPPILTGPVSLCDGQNGTIDITNSSDYTSFLWVGGQTTSSISVNQSGTYSVTVTNSGGCTATGNYTVAEGLGASITTSVTPATCGQNNGGVDLTTSPPGSYTFIWSSGSNTEDLVNIPGGTYSVTVTSTDGCTATAIADVADNPIAINITENITHHTSCNVNDGAIDISITPSETYTYLWSNGATTQDLNNLASGNYSVTVTTGINCSSTADYIVQNLANDPDIQSIPSPATCGESNGSIDLQVSNGESPYTFLWSNGNTTQGLDNIPGNTYSVTVTGSNGCTSSTIVDLPDVDIPIDISSQITPNTSCINSNGSIDITLSPSGSYNFLWSNGATTEDLTNIGAGTYEVTVTLGINCLQTGIFTVTNENIPFTINGSSSPNTSCTTPNGAIDLTITPAGGYTYEWSSGETSEDLQNLGAGSYIVTVTNSDGCSITSSFDIVSTFPTIVISGISISNTSCQVPNGSLDISILPSGTYTFLWSNGATTEDLQNISGGTYEVTVTDSNGCTANSAFTIDNQFAIFSLSAIPVTNNSCTNPNGSLDLSINPAGTYTYLWSNGATTEDIQSLPAGIYSVTVSDTNNCSSSASYIIDNNTPDPVVLSLITPETCGAANGGIDLTITPAGNTFLWSSGSTTEDLQNITAGIYNVTITGTNGCMTLDTFNVANLNSNFSLSAVPIPNSSCIQPNGSLNLTVTPSSVYTFLWSNGATTEDLQNLAAGQYQVTVTDPFNCSSSLILTIDNNTVDPIISQTITPASCGQNNGVIELSVIPATGNTFTWSNGSSTEDLQNIAPGSYSVTVTGGNGCSTIASFVVPNNNSSFSINGVANANTSCLASNGSIDLIIMPVGTYTYIWSNGSSSPNQQNLAPGNYIVTVTDEFNCTSMNSFTIDDNTSNPVISQNIIPATCGQNNGSINISISPSGINTFLWTNGNTNEDLINVFAGSYEVTVTDGNGCSAVALFIVPNNNSNFSITSVISDDNSCTNPTGAIDLTITPAGTYSFSWSNGSATEDLSNIASGIYEVTVTDNFNCASSEIFSIESTASFPLLSEILTYSTCGENNGSIDLTVIPSNGNQFIWSTGDTGEDLDNISKGVYSVTVTDINGCSASSAFTIPESKALEVIIDADLSAINDGVVTCSLQLNVPLSTIDTIVWMPASLFSCNQPVCLEQVFTLIERTEVMVMVIDTNGCMGQASLLLDVDKEFQVYIPNVFTPNGDGPNDMFTIYSNKEVEEVVRLEIFDRWGNLLFINESFPPNEPSYGWDGIFKGQMMNPEVFAYWAVVRYSNGEEHSFKGDVTLVR